MYQWVIFIPVNGVSNRTREVDFLCQEISCIAVAGLIYWQYIESYKLNLEGIVMTETMGVAIGIGVFALVFIYLGCLMWKKEKITLLHSYHYDKVSPSDKKVFCKISGWGVIFIGIGLLVTAIIIGITDSALSFIAFALGFVVGLALLIYAGAKYNR